MSLTSIARGTAFQAPLVALSGDVPRLRPDPRADAARDVELELLPPTALRSQKISIAIMMLVKVDPRDLTLSEREGWFLSAANLVMPGLAEMWRPSNVRFVQKTMSDADIRALCSPGNPGIATGPFSQMVSETGVDGVGFGPTAPQAILAALLFAVVKGPSDLSAAKYCTARFAAACAAASVMPDPAIAPARHHYEVVNSMVNINAALRETIAGWAVEIILKGAGDPVSGSLISQARLWRGAGAQGLMLVSRFMLRYSRAVENIASLQDELEAYREHAKVYDSETDDRKDYYLALYGPRNPIAARRPYGQLVAIARHFDTTGMASMKNFAGTRKTPSLAEVIANAVALGLNMPT